MEPHQGLAVPRLLADNERHMFAQVSRRAEGDDFRLLAGADRQVRAGDDSERTGVGIGGKV